MLHCIDKQGDPINPPIRTKLRQVKIVRLYCLASAAKPPPSSVAQNSPFGKPNCFTSLRYMRPMANPMFLKTDGSTIKLCHIRRMCFAEVSNEWLLQNTPFTHGDIDFSAKNASQQAKLSRNKAQHSPICNLTHYMGSRKAVTMVELVFHAGHRNARSYRRLYSSVSHRYCLSYLKTSCSRARCTGIRISKTSVTE